MITRATGRETRYSYDAYGRLAQVQHWGWIATGGTPPLVLQEIADERMDYHYDVNPCDGSYSQNAWGRLAAVSFPLNGYSDGCQYQYSYNAAGRVTAQKMRWTMHEQVSEQVSNEKQFALTAGYEWDNEGRMTAMTYPSVSGTGTRFAAGFDEMGRLNSFAGTTATYGIAGEILTLGGETRTYNNMFQMTRQTVAGMMDMQYVYTAGANNGRIAKSVDGVTGETVDYTYDVWNRLLKAETEGTTGVQWGQSYTYDGFGNLTAKGATKGSAPTFSTTINPATNGGPASYAPEADNGATDVEGRPKGSTTGQQTFGWGRSVAARVYDQAGKRVLAWSGDANGYWYSGNWEFAMYGLGGQRLLTVNCSYPNGVTPQCVEAGKNLYFGGKLVQSRGVGVVTDRLGSVRANSNGERFSYYPYGEERTTTADGREKFGTYVRDSATQDYADQRYYQVGMGRYSTPKFYEVDPGSPEKLNQYAYVQGDPVNYNNPHGGVEDEEPFPPFDPFVPLPPPQGPGGPGGGGPLGPPSLQVLRQLFLDPAIAGAKVLLSNPDCQSIFDTLSMDSNFGTTDPGQILQGANDHGQIYFGPFGDAVPLSVPAQTTETNGSIQIASNRAFVTGLAFVQIPDTDPLNAANFTVVDISQTPGFAGLNRSEINELILIHELLHFTGTAGSDNARQTVTLGNGESVTGSAGVTQAVRSHCLHH